MKQDPPAKLYHSISEVAAITGVKAHVLRYWEAEFPSLRPGKTRSGSRRYREADIQEVLAIKALLYDEGFKIAGARKARRQTRSQAAPEPGSAPQMALPFDRMDSVQQMAFLKEELRELLAMVRTLGGALSTPPPAAPATGRKTMRAKG
jgi:DNA-binding transcriptional MerR regulator